MKERPIVFAADAVPAIYDLMETQTRRLVLPQPASARSAISAQCPYGEPGDTLWVREKWAILTKTVVYGAKTALYDRTRTQLQSVKWNSPTTMPRSAARLFLTIRNVRIQRLQDITKGEAQEEGYEFSARYFPREWFALTWDRSARRSGYTWKKNPFVWVIEFKVDESKTKDVRENMRPVACAYPVGLQG